MHWRKGTFLFLVFLIVSGWGPDRFVEAKTVPFLQGTAVERGFSLSLEGWVQNVEPSVHTTSYAHATYQTYRYEKPGHSFKLSLIRLENGDVLYFARNEKGTDKGRVQLNIEVQHKGTFEVRTVHPDIQRMNLPDHLKKTIFVDGASWSYRIGSVRTFTPLGYTVHHEHTDRVKAVRVKRERETVSYQIPFHDPHNAIVETWGVLSGHPLLDWDHEGMSRFVKTVDDPNRRWLRMDGMYTKLPYYQNRYDYEPGTATSFYRNPANVEGETYAHYLKTAKFRYVHDLLTHWAYSAVENQNDAGYWYTYPKSRWLDQDYGIGYTYMDNRKNIDNASFLRLFQQWRPDEAVRQALHRFDAYHADYIRRHGIDVSGNAVLLPDYVDEDGTGISHISLNHHVANMNYLYNRYRSTGQDSYKKRGERLLYGISTTVSLWLKENHNLHYALNSDLHSLGVPDYHRLTLNDLTKAQRLLQDVYGHTSPHIQRLIEAKNQYLSSLSP